MDASAFSYLLNATSQPVDWAYEVWDELIIALSDREGRTRSIAAQLLCNLGTTDPEGRRRCRIWGR